MTKSTLVDLPILLPDVPGEDDACVARLQSAILEQRGVLTTRVVAAEEGRSARLWLEFDPEVISLQEVERQARAAGARVARRFGHLVLPVRVVDGEDSGRRIEDALLAVPGVLVASMSLPAQRVGVEYDRRRTSRRQVEEALLALGYSVGEPADETAPPPSAPGTHAHAHTHAHSHVHGVGCCRPREAVAPEAPWYQRHRELTLSLIAGGLLVLGLAGEWWFGLPRPAAVAVFALSYAFGAFDIVRHWAGSLRAGRVSLDIDLLMLLAALGAAVLGEWAEGALLLFLFSLAHALEHYALGRARNAIRALADLAPATARVLRGGRELEVPVEQVTAGEIVVVHPAERIPVDGEVHQGRSAVDQAPITGESVPVAKSGGDEVFAGSVNGDGALEILATRIVGDRTLDRVVRLVEEAQTQKAPTQRFTERFSRVFVPSALVAVVVMMTVPPLLGMLDWSTSFYRAMALLVAVSPCALALGTPATVLAGIAQAARNGVLIKGGVYLEQLGAVRVIALDKTGTLTRGEPEVSDMVPLPGVTGEELLRIAAAVERRSQHPLARAVVRRAEADGLALPDAGELQSLTSLGVRSSVGGEAVEIGRLPLWSDGPAAPPAEILEAVRRLESSGRSVMAVRHGNRWLGVIGVQDLPRPGAGRVIERLHALGIGKIVMLTGDNRSVAETVARETGIDAIHADLMPEEKLAHIRDLAERFGDVAMVGDGINDAPALAHASVGIAMGGAGTAVALETADVALMADDLNRLPFAIGLSRRARAIIRQNLFISLGVIALLAVATVSGTFGLGMAVAVHEGSTLIVIANALRLLGYSGPPAGTRTLPSIPARAPVAAPAG
jgi:Zn2+/Cd2+-exporting ATPase